jgi:hypothetical protein
MKIRRVSDQEMIDLEICRFSSGPVRVFSKTSRFTRGFAKYHKVQYGAIRYKRKLN